jgi:glucokinase
MFASLNSQTYFYYFTFFLTQWSYKKYILYIIPTQRKKMNLYIDFGATNFRYKLNDSQIYTLDSTEIKLVPFLEDIISKNQSIKTISISFAGLVKNGVIIKSPNIDIKDLDIKNHIEKKYNIELKIDNDLNCASLGEKNSLNASSLAIFYIGTGFGSAFIDDNRLVKGINNQSGEIGHIPFKKSPFRCGCGRDDCIELFCSGSAIIKWCKYYHIDEKFHRLDKLRTLDTKEAKIIIDNFYNALSHAFHTTLNLFDFSSLVLGGSVGKNEFIKEFLEDEFKKNAFSRESLDIKISTLENGALEGTKYL